MYCVDTLSYLELCIVFEEMVPSLCGRSKSITSQLKVIICQGPVVRRKGSAVLVGLELNGSSREPVRLPNHTFPGQVQSSKQLTNSSAHSFIRN